MALVVRSAREYAPPFDSARVEEVPNPEQYQDRLHAFTTSALGPDAAAAPGAHNGNHVIAYVERSRNRKINALPLLAFVSVDTRCGDDCKCGHDGNKRCAGRLKAFVVPHLSDERVRATFQHAFMEHVMTMYWLLTVDIHKDNEARIAAFHRLGFHRTKRLPALTDNTVMTRPRIEVESSSDGSSSDEDDVRRETGAQFKEGTGAQFETLWDDQQE